MRTKLITITLTTLGIFALLGCEKQSKETETTAAEPAVQMGTMSNDTMNNESMAQPGGDSMESDNTAQPQ
ncbi:MAG: hypothetical protein OEZ43_02415 [Gammaproteobacteria bacterium]|nr:hypothetical protein [Gammaproteobacteria bacterium]